MKRQLSYIIIAILFVSCSTSSSELKKRKQTLGDTINAIDSQGQIVTDEYYDIQDRFGKDSAVLLPRYKELEKVREDLWHREDSLEKIYYKIREELEKREAGN